MKKSFYSLKVSAFIVIILASFSSCIKDRITDEVKVPGVPIDPGTRELIHYWDFNSANLTNAKKTIGGAALEILDLYDDTEGSTLNLRENSDSGSALRVRNPSTEMIIKAPTTGYKKPLFTYAVMRTNNGAKENLIEYTIDGINFISTGLPATTIDIDTTWRVFSIDFSEIEAADNNPYFAIKIIYNVGNNNASGNDRFDNISIDALKIDNTNPGNPTTPSDVDSLIHYWNFNGSTLLNATQSIGNSSITYTATFDPVNEGSALNARNNDESGNALRLRNPASDLIIKIPTTGFDSVRVNYVIMRTGNGAQTNNIFYTLDGTNYINTALANNSYSVSESFVLQELDFSKITGVNNNSNFGIKIEFADGSTNTSGNNRIDNLTVEAKLQ